MHQKISALQFLNMGILVKVSGADCIFLALLCLILPFDWMIAAVTAGAFHELCHILAVRLTGGTIYDLKIGANGAVMDVSCRSVARELICALAGPVGSLSLLFFAEYIPKIALCGMVQGIYNLLPVYPLDGGRAISCAAGMLLSPETSEKICSIIKWVTILLVTSAGIWGTFGADLGLMPVFLSIFLLSRAMTGKFPCKQGKQRVQ